jgi:hypothetical protein
LILYCDEDVGTRVPKALKLVGLRALSAVAAGTNSEPDIQWLARVGTKRWPGLSCNKNMPNVPEERDAIVNHAVGIVFLFSGNLHPKEKLLLVLRKWTWLEQVDLTERRPFAYFLYDTGQTRKAL